MFAEVSLILLQIFHLIMPLMRFHLLVLFSFVTLSGYCQTCKPMSVPVKALSQLEDYKELTKREVAAGLRKGQLHAEVNPELNRWLVVAADEFARVAANSPTKEAYLRCIDRGLASLAPLTHSAEERKQVAQYYQELMEIVGLESSEGRLDAFAGVPDTTAKLLLSQRELGNR